MTWGATQPSLFGDVELPKTNRYFFGIYPDAPAQALLSERARFCGERRGFRSRPMRSDLLHATLNHLGEFGEEPTPLITKAKEAGANLNFAPFKVTFDRAGGFRKPFVLQGGAGVEGLKALQKALGDAMGWAGLGRLVETSITPHITLFYNEEGPEIFPIEPVTWTVGEVVLIHSLIGKATHRVLGRFPLIG